MASVSYVGATGDKDIDGLLSGYRWNGVLTYSFPDAPSDYSSHYGYNEPLYGFAQVSAAQQTVIHRAMALVTEYTNLTVQYSGTDGADIRIAQSSRANPTAYAYYPGSNVGGDIWFGNSYNYRAPKLGDYSHLTHLHELGHALGLKHGHEVEGPGNTALPVAHDSLEYSVMSYRSYVGEVLGGGYRNETYGFPTTFMMNDIRALQEMYGADFTTHSGDTVYSWSATTGEFSIDGVGQGRPGGANASASANVVFMTVWDGNGNDTYDFSNYTTGVTVNLSPGAYSITSAAQTAYLGDGHYARGTVFNAYLHDGDSRSYIENAIGGTGNDALIGNAVANRLDGRAGNDTLTGGSNGDVFVFGSGYGVDIVTDFSIGFDRIDFTGLSGYDDYASVMAAGSQLGLNAVFAFSLSLKLTLQNVTFSMLGAADFIFSWTDPDADPGVPGAAPTAISLSNLSVSENAAGAIIGSLDVADLDDTAFQFNLSDNRFQVTGAPGAYVLKLANGVSLDFEAGSDIAITVTATDNDGLSFAQDFTILVSDVGGATVTGTAGRDTIDGKRTVSGQSKATIENDIINAGAGSDVVSALGGNDVIDGGAGDDVLNGDDGDDRITGGLGNDRTYGGAGNDVFVIEGADATFDTISGGAGNDSIEVAGTGAVTLSRFSALANSIETWTGNGQAVLGTARHDILEFSALQSASGITYIDGGAGNDVLAGSAIADDLRGGTGNDCLYGHGGDDRLTGGAGNDLVFGGAGDDVIVIEASDAAYDTISGGGGDDSIEVAGTGAVTLSRFSAAAASIEAWIGNGEAVLGTARHDILDFSALESFSGIAYIDGGAGNDALAGTSGADDLRGGLGNDSVYGHDGDDRLTGGAGTDSVFGGAGDDTLVFGGAEATYDIMSGGAGLDTAEITGTANVTLSRFNAASASIEVWHGNDAGVVGTRGADTLDFSGLTSVSRLAFIDAGDGNDTVVGTAGADVIRGGTGNDLLTGGGGDDLLTGGRGLDRFSFAAGFGNDIITDFEAGSRAGDVIVMDRTVFADLNSLLAATSQVGSDVVITASATDSITLQNLTLSSLHANDFAFV